MRMARFVRSSSVVSRVIAGETLIVPIRGGVGDLASIYSLNPVATAIWNSISEPRTKDEIATRIQQEYEVSLDALLADLETFLHEMSAAGLIQAVDAEMAA